MPCKKCIHYEKQNLKIIITKMMQRKCLLPIDKNLYIFNVMLLELLLELWISIFYRCYTKQSVLFLGLFVNILF